MDFYCKYYAKLDQFMYMNALQTDFSLITTPVSPFNESDNSSRPHRAGVSSRACVYVVRKTILYII